MTQNTATNLAGVISTYYVLRAGDDETGTGSESRPYKTLAKLPRSLRGKDRIIVYLDDGTNAKAIEEFLGSVTEAPLDVMFCREKQGNPTLSRLAAVNLCYFPVGSGTLTSEDLATPLVTGATLALKSSVGSIPGFSTLVDSGAVPKSAVVYESAQTAAGQGLTVTNTNLTFPLRMLSRSSANMELALTEIPYSLALVGFSFSAVAANGVASLLLYNCSIRGRYSARKGTCLGAIGSVFSGIVNTADSVAAYSNCVLSEVEFGDIAGSVNFNECVFLACRRLGTNNGSIAAAFCTFRESQTDVIVVDGGNGNFHDIVMTGDQDGIVVNKSPATTLTKITGQVGGVAVVAKGESTVAISSVTLTGDKGDVSIEGYNSDQVMRWNEKGGDGTDLLPLEKPVGNCGLVTLRPSPEQRLAEAYLIPNPESQLPCLNPIYAHGRISYVPFDPCKEQDIEVAYFTDARGFPRVQDSGVKKYEALIEWGDGTATKGECGPSEIFPNKFKVHAKHLYKNSGTYDVFVAVADSLTVSKDFGKSAVSAADCEVLRALRNRIRAKCVVAPPLKINSRVRLWVPLGDAHEILLATFTDSRTSDGVRDVRQADAYEVTVDWDRAHSPRVGQSRVVALGNGVYGIMGTQTYTQPGLFEVHISVRDKLHPYINASVITPLLAGDAEQTKIVQLFHKVLVNPEDHYGDAVALARDHKDVVATAKHILDYKYDVKANLQGLIAKIASSLFTPEDWLKLFPILETTYWNTFRGDGSLTATPNGVPLNFNDPNYAATFGGSMGLFLRSGSDYPREWEPLLSQSEIADNNNDLLCGLSGTVIGEHFSAADAKGDVPMTHMFGNDYNMDIQPDDGYGNLLAINNFDIDRDTSNTFNQGAPDVDPELHSAAQDAEQLNPDGYRGVLHVEIARGFLPTGGRPGSEDVFPDGSAVLDDGLLDFTTQRGDRAAIFGRWILDAGHPSYDNEIHPPLIMVFGRVYDDGKYGQAKYTRTWLNSRPYLESQYFGNNGHTLYGYLKDQIHDKAKGDFWNPLGTQPSPFEVRQKALPTSPYTVGSSMLFIHYVVRPPTERKKDSDILRTRFRFFVTVGTFVFVQNNGDDGVHVVIRTNEGLQEWVTEAPPASVKYNYKLEDFVTDDQKQAIYTNVDHALTSNSAPGYVINYVHACIDQGIDTYKCHPSQYPRNFMQYTLTNNDYLADVDVQVTDLPSADNPPLNDEVTDNVLGNYKFVAGTSSYPCFGYLDVYWETPSAPIG